MDWYVCMYVCRDNHTLKILCLVWAYSSVVKLKNNGVQLLFILVVVPISRSSGDFLLYKNVIIIHYLQILWGYLYVVFVYLI